MAPRKSVAPDITAADLDGLVVVCGPRKCLSAAGGSCIRSRRLEPGLTYRPVVEVRDGSDRLYSKNNLPLFETIGPQPTHEPPAPPVASNGNGGPAGAVLRRRQQQRRSIGLVVNPMRRDIKLGNGADVEDVSDEHYRKLHRKPEYMEKRIRNREIELYQYSRWQESQHLQRAAAMAQDTATSAEAMVTEDDSPLLLPPVEMISEALRKLDSSDDAGSSGHRPQQRRRKELLALADSTGYQKARQKQDPLNQQIQLLPEKQHIPMKQQMEQKQRLQKASEHDRKMTRLGGVILEQLLVQASRLPPEPPARTHSKAGDDGNDDRPPAYPCCPRDFELPQRLHNQMIKLQQQQQRPS